MSTWFRREKRDAITVRCIRLAALTDLVFAGLALWAAHFVRFEWLPDAEGQPKTSVVVMAILLGAVLYFFFVHIFDGYRRFTLLRYRRSFPIVVKAVFAWLIAYPAFTLFFEVLPNVSRVFIFLGALFILIFCALGRFALQRILLSAGLTAAFRQRILFVDWTKRVQKLVDEIQKDKWHPYEIVGIAPPQSNRFTLDPPNDIHALGSHAELDHFCESGLVNIVILGDGPGREAEAVSLASLCERSLVSFMMIPSGFQILLSGLQITTISSVPVLGITELPLERPVYAMLKRVFDIVGSLVGLVVFAPVIAVFGCLVMWESPGAIFYRQVRVGRNGREFQIIKIRSMRLDAEVGSGARWATKDDARRLKIGAFMRRWNIDELPQFWNVLRGDMSLVGPRPERPELIVNFKETIAHYNARHHIVPGITGWAQVNGLRGDTDLSERIRYDLYYMENWSLALDIQIMLMTFFRYHGAA